MAAAQKAAERISKFSVLLWFSKQMGGTAKALGAPNPRRLCVHSNKNDYVGLKTVHPLCLMVYI